MSHNFWPVSGQGANTGGWFWNSDSSKREGGVGIQTFDLWNYYEFLVQEKSLAYRIDNIY
jgi:hypothetical protein